MNILLIDNYDSFTYNLVHYLEKVEDCQVEVCRNDQVTPKLISSVDKIVLSPGPGLPSEAGNLLEIIKNYSPSKSILGICLGLQAIAEAFGATLINPEEVFHGISTPIEIIKKDPLFEGLPSRFRVGRYHSWVVNPIGFPKDLEVTAKDSQGCIMALRHKTYDVRAVQFHPESILTEHGEQLIRNWVQHLPSNIDFA